MAPNYSGFSEMGLNVERMFETKQAVKCSLIHRGRLCRHLIAAPLRCSFIINAHVLSYLMKFAISLEQAR